MTSALPLQQKIQDRTISDFMKEANRHFKIVMLGSENVGIHTIINNMITSDSTFLPSTIPGITISIMIEGDNVVSLYTREMSELTEIGIKEFYKNAEGVIAVFDMTNRESFKAMQEQIGEMIIEVGKYLPTIMIGNKADLKENSEDPLTIEEVLEYAYELGDCACHRVPFVEISAIQNFGYDKVVSDVIAMADCDLTVRCADRPALLRDWCKISQFYSFYEEILDVK